MRRITCAVSVLAATLLAGCGTDPLEAFPRQFTNVPDRFEFETFAEVSDITRTDTFQWSSSGPITTITSTTSADVGEARLVLRDANGTEVYDAVLGPATDDVSEAGVAGQWTIELVLTNFSGDIQFVVETPAAMASTGS